MFIIVLCVFFGLLLLGAPIAFVLGLTGISHLALMSPDYFSVIPQRMFAGWHQHHQLNLYSVFHRCR